jgi:hypothetical protein
VVSTEIEDRDVVEVALGDSVATWRKTRKA